MNNTGIGYAGLDGVWWRPATNALRLPLQAQTQLAVVARALFLFFDTVIALYDAPTGEGHALRRLLEHKVPLQLLERATSSPAPVLALRPDFQVQRSATGTYTFWATELEICPSAQGFAHAMQVGYGLRPDLVEAFSAILQGRPLLFAGVHEWSEFIFEQLAFCRALAEMTHGVQAHVLFDRPLRQLASEVASGQRWQPPLFGVSTKATTWDGDIYQRLKRHGLQPYLWPQDDSWPASVGNAVVVRFGYVDNFAPEHYRCFHRWALQGATMLNPARHLFDSKVLLAALQLPEVRQRVAAINASALTTLDQCLPETILITGETMPRLVAEKDDWVVKYAGFDQGNQAWGGRSLHIGAHSKCADWTAHLHSLLALPWPVVAQRTTPSLKIDISYFDAAGAVHWLCNGTTRLRAFFLRDPQRRDGVFVGGAHITVTDSVKVGESTTAVQAPIDFVG
jgi:hypothetical protein